MRFHLVSFFLLPILLAGCKVGPHYRRPRAEVPNQWTGAAENRLTTQPLAATQWWTLLNDERLNSLIERAERSNLDMKLAAERILEARAERQVVAADLFPSLNASSSFSRSQRSGASSSPSSAGSSSGGSSATGTGDSSTGGGSSGTGDTGSGSASAGASSASTPKPNLTSNSYRAGFDASWEIDVFGGTRRAIEAAEAGIEAAVEDLRDVQVTLFGEVARNYILLRGLQYQLEINRKTIAAQQKTQELTQTRYEGGIASRLDVTRAEAQLAVTRSQTPTLETNIRQTIYRLGVLLGQDPGALSRELTPTAAIPVPPQAVAVGLPSELLHRRPDIRRAEREVAAATARIGAATAELFPRFMLTGSLGTQGLEASDLFHGSSRYWSLGPSVRWPILDFGRISGNIDVENARQRQALIRYQQVILGALEEAEDAFVAYAQEQLRRQWLQAAVTANQQTVEMAGLQYTAGISDFLNVLDAQRTLYASQLLLAQSETIIATNLVALYKALGGGWEPAAARPR